MSVARADISSISDYIATQPLQVQAVLKKIRAGIRKGALTAIERISYRMPAFELHGILVYFAAFKSHIGLYPPVRGGDDKLMMLKASFEGPKGNLIFPLDEPIPYALIADIVKLRARQNLAKFASKGRAKPKK